MSAVDDISRLRHIADACREALLFIEGCDRADLSKNRMLALSLVKELEIIGEAANNISKDCQDLYPQVPWRAIVGMRNRLIHAYFGIDYDVVWQTVTESLPALLVEVEGIIKNETNV
ncbi:MAG: DUF86 domain-containing protein [Pleurocapsa minor HA4230-MV1]|jgi:uncharacterized protein with HEPN domain|nr:DUF86 domain-containing protein [Pleurocapsa minor HA4230-MV1]